MTSLDADRQRVRTEGLSLPYDYLVVAGGSAVHFLGVPGAAEHAFPRKFLDNAIALRNHSLACFVRAEQHPPGAERGQWLTFVIVNGGPSGGNSPGRNGDDWAQRRRLD